MTWYVKAKRPDGSVASVQCDEWMQVRENRDDLRARGFHVWVEDTQGREIPENASDQGREPMPSGPKGQQPLPDDPEQSKRFIDMAREVGADEDPEAFERAFREVVKPKIPKPGGDGQKPIIFHWR